MGKSHCVDANLVVYSQQNRIGLTVDGEPILVSERIEKIIRWLITRSDALDQDKLRITINIAGSSIRYELATFDAIE